MAANLASIAINRERRVVEVDPTTDPRWDAFVRADPAATFYHLAAWKRVLEQTYHFQPLYLAATVADGSFEGVLPLFVVQSPLTGRKLISLPFSDICGPLARTKDALRSLLDHACDLADDQHAKYVQIRSSRGDLHGIQPRLVADTRYADFVLGLEESPDILWNNPILAKVRGHVRKAARSGVTISRGETRQDVQEFYALHLRTTKKHGMPAQPLDYFLNLVRTLAADCDVRLLLARHGGRTIAASLFIGFSDHVCYVYNASEPSALSLGPNDLLLWEAIQWACQGGYRRFSFGKTSLDNHGLVTFKRGWGAEALPLHYYYYPDVDGLTSTAYSERSWKYQVVTAIWRALPGPLTDRVGGILYRHLA